LGNDVGLDKLFFELASESRLNILQELQKENLKMQEIARRLDVTATEAFRQLERLSAAFLVQRQPDGTFALTEYGKLVLLNSASLGFLSKHKEYFSAHDLVGLPSQFVNRLGELSQATLEMDTIAVLNFGTQTFAEAKEYAYGMGEGTIPGQMSAVMDRLVKQGLKIKMLISEERLPAGKDQSPMPINVEIRGVPDLPVLIVLTEKAAGVCFRLVGGRMDYTGFCGADTTFRDWVKDLFLFYWEKAKRV
jgi:predicted transcriptional regulator